jgi:diguanylate cyclase (GGDEF)-like protein
MHPERAFGRQLLASRAGPFVAVALAPMLILAFKSGVAQGDLLLAAALLMVLIAAILLLPWKKLPPWTAAIVPLSYLIVVALMRSSERGATITSGALVLLPVVWFALYGNRRELTLAIVGAMAVFVVPALFAGGLNHFVSELNKAVTLGLVVTLIGFTVHRLVGENSALIAKLNLAAHRDHLTELPNRHAWTALVKAAIATSARTGEPLFVAMIDLDGLKAINDEGGHAAGDLALLTASNTWCEAMPESGALARLGGDEFALLLPSMTPAAAMDAVEVIQRSTSLTLPCSIGLIRHRAAESASSILKRADLALYVAKAGGGNQISDATRSHGEPDLLGAPV